MIGENPIDRLIQANEAKIASLERTVEKLRIELVALRKAREAVAESDADTAEQPANGHDTTPTEAKRGRSLSANWKAVLRGIEDKGGHGADLDDIERLCRRQGIEIQRSTLRAQVWGYVNRRHYLKRNVHGRFVLDNNGLEVSGLAGKESGTPAQTGAPENGGVTGGSSSS